MLISSTETKDEKSAPAAGGTSSLVSRRRGKLSRVAASIGRRTRMFVWVQLSQRSKLDAVWIFYDLSLNSRLCGLQ